MSGTVSLLLSTVSPEITLQKKYYVSFVTFDFMVPMSNNYNTGDLVIFSA